MAGRPSIARKLAHSALAQRARRFPNKPSQKYGEKVVSQDRPPARTSKFTDSKFVGDSVITEDDSGRIGVGTTLPTSQLTVNGVIEMMGAAGGIKFPDGTLQTTAGLATVSRDNTLKGNGTQASPLGVAVPLNLNGDVRFGSVLVVSNTHEVSTEASGSSDRKCVGRNGEHGGR